MSLHKLKFWQRQTEQSKVDTLMTIVEILQHRAKSHSNKTAFLYLYDGETETASISYDELDQTVQKIAAGLQERLATGARVLLLYPSGIEFISAFYGCLYAGMIAVPATAPRNQRAYSRLESIVSDAQPELILTDSTILKKIEADCTGTAIETIPRITNRALIDSCEHPWRSSAITGDTIAFLQYTSGSTAQPKGVVIQHKNMLANNQMIHDANSSREENIYVSWLPMFHDMGLVGNVLQTVYTGGTCVFMPPEAFLMKPIRWLQAISKYRAIRSGGPNFAYELCLRRIKDEQLVGLNLDSWQTAYVGAEPVRTATMQRFLERFAPVGLKNDALYPCYGMAEACLFISGNQPNRGAISTYFCSDALSKGIASPIHETDSSLARPLVSCGHGWRGQEILIVDPSTSQPAKNGQIGEIWVTGDNIAQGYWNKPAETEAAFHATIKDQPHRHYLRTGDLGFIHDGGLYISGRLKDYIIIAGRNHHPVDIEHTIEQCHKAIRPGGTGAFSIDLNDEECLIIVTELERSARNVELSEIEQAILSAIATEHDLMVREIHFLKPATCPKTSSGKVMRHACKIAWQQNALTLWKTDT